MSRTDLFADLMQGLRDAREHDRGKLTLRTTAIEIKEPYKIIRKYPKNINLHPQKSNKN